METKIMRMNTKGGLIGLIGDLHLGKHKDEHWIDIFDDLKDWIIRSMEGEVDTLMFLGDVFDGHKEKTNEKSITFKMLEYVSTFFDELAEKFVIVVYAGNHCCYYKNRCDVSGLALLKGRENIHVIEETTTFEAGGKLYKIVPWACGIDDGGVVDGIFGHFDIKSFQMSANKVSEHGLTSKDLFKYTTKVYTGHYHTAQYRQYKGGKSIMYVGSPLQLSWAEAGNESAIYIMDFKTNEIIDTFYNQISPKFVKITASELIANTKAHIGDVLEIFWDIENNEENVMAINNIIESAGNFSCKNNFQAKRETIIGDIASTNSSVDTTEILDIYTDAIVDISDECRASIKETGAKYLELTM